MMMVLPPKPNRKVRKLHPARASLMEGRKEYHRKKSTIRYDHACADLRTHSKPFDTLWLGREG